jgi:hypothetical protein
MLPIRSKSVHDGISIPLNRRGRVTFRSAMQFNFRAFLGERDVVEWRREMWRHWWKYYVKIKLWREIQK